MLNTNLILLTTLLGLFFNYVFLKKNFLLDLPNIEKHKRLASKKKIPISLGLIFVLLNSYLFIESTNYVGLLVLMIYFVGLSSDTRYLKSPLWRLIFQSLTILVYLFLSRNVITDTRIFILDILLDNYFFSVFFTLFCLTILINGTNFIDGINTLVIGYYIIVLACVVLVFNEQGLQLDNYTFQLLSILVIFFIFNVLGKSFLGDGGSYSLSFAIGIFLISISSNNYMISPWMIVLLLWYPAFENLFSIIRRQSYNFALSKADSLHLHQLFFTFIKRNLKLNYFLANLLTSLIINIFNATILFFGSLHNSNTQILILLICLNIFVYVYTYLYFVNYFKKYNRKN